MTTREVKSCVVAVIEAVAPRGALMDDRRSGQWFVKECTALSSEETGFVRLTAHFKA